MPSKFYCRICNRNHSNAYEFAHHKCRGKQLKQSTLDIKSPMLAGGVAIYYINRPKTAVVASERNRFHKYYVGVIKIREEEENDQENFTVKDVSKIQESIV